MTSSTLTKNDTYSLHPILSRRDKIVEIVNEGLYTSNNKQVLNSCFDVLDEPAAIVIPEITPVFAHVLGASEFVVEQSLSSILPWKSQGYPGLNDIRETAHYLSGNVEMLHSGIPVTPFVSLREAEWSPAIVIDQRMAEVSGNKGNIFTFRVQGGSASTVLLTKFFSSKAQFWMKRMFGLAKYCKPKGGEFVGMYSWLLLDPSERRNGKEPAGFSRMEATNTFASKNRKLFNEREKPCPYGYQRKCTRCDIGFKDCFRGTHLLTYVRGWCKLCDRQDARFTEQYKETESDRVCFDCAKRTGA